MPELIGVNRKGRFRRTSSTTPCDQNGSSSSCSASVSRMSVVSCSRMTFASRKAYSGSLSCSGEESLTPEARRWSAHPRSLVKQFLHAFAALPALFAIEGEHVLKLDLWITSSPGQSGRPGRQRSTGLWGRPLGYRVPAWRGWDYCLPGRPARRALVSARTCPSRLVRNQSRSRRTGLPVPRR
jgi:hypothetical protein